MKMRISERQRDGAIVAVIIAVIAYTLSYAFLMSQSKVFDLPHSDKGYGQLIVGFIVNEGTQNIYWLPWNSTVKDLLKAAGIENVERFDENKLQAQLTTGNAVFIESDSKIELGEMKNASKVALNIPININNATLEDLMLIPGIGEKTALRIIQYRESLGNFRKLEDLMNIHGIKEKKFTHLKKYLYAGKIS